MTWSAISEQPLISRREIKLPEDGFSLQYRSEGEDTPAPDARSYVVRLQPTGTLSMSTLLDYTTSADGSSLFGTKQELIQALNLVLSHQPKSQPDISTVGRNRHASLAAGADRLSLGAGLEALRAFVFSVRAATERILVNVQIKNMPFYERGPLQQLAHSFIKANGPSRPALATFLKRLSIEVLHIRRVNKAGQRIPRYKMISGLAMRADGRDLPNPPEVPSYGAGPKEVKFFLQDDTTSGSAAGSSKNEPGKGKAKGKSKTVGKGRYISVFDFFRERKTRLILETSINGSSNSSVGYNIVVTDTTLPVINVGSAGNPSYLPMQVCEVQPGQPARGQLSPMQTQLMIKFAVRKPAQNASSIVTSGIQLLGLEGSNPYLVSDTPLPSYTNSTTRV